MAFRITPDERRLTLDLLSLCSMQPIYGINAQDFGVFCALAFQAALRNRNDEVPWSNIQGGRACNIQAATFRRSADHLVSEGLIERTENGFRVPIIAQWRAFAGRRPLPTALRKQVIERDGMTCRYCGGEADPLHIDHIVPVVRGGTDDLGNLAVACGGCNLSKGALTLEEWKGGV